MAALTLKGVPDELLERLREIAKSERRSLNQQVVYMLETASGHRHLLIHQDKEAQIAAWKKLAGRWESNETVEEEIAAIYAARTMGRDIDL